MIRARLVQPANAPNFCFAVEVASRRKKPKVFKGLHGEQERDWSVPIDGDELAFVQSDWEYPGLAAAFGWRACPCGRTDGTVACEHRTVSEMLAEARDYLSDHVGDVVWWEDAEHGWGCD